MALDLVLFGIGLAGLYYGSEWLVEGAGRLATSFGVSSFVVGLTVVAFGTSAPELVVSVLAAARGSGSLAIGNVVGSNIANIALILGTAAIIHPILVRRTLLVRDVPIMIGFAILFLILGWDGVLARWEAGLLLVLFAMYLTHVVYDARQNPAARHPLDELDTQQSGRGRDVLMTVGGILVLVIGAQFLVNSAVNIARDFGVSEVIIGLTMVALGTSLPELAASVAAARRGEGQLVIGNIVGSNIFNIALILGVAGLVTPLPVEPQVIAFDAPVMIALSLLLFPFVLPSRKLSRVEAIGLVIIYISYIGWIVYA